MKFAFVIHRFPTADEASYVGGAEMHAKLLAKHFTGAGHQVAVYTTCAADVNTWRNVYPAGTASEGGISVHRFPTEAERHEREFRRLSEEVFVGLQPREREEVWMRSQGPYVPALIAALQHDEPQYDFIFFFGYLFWTTYVGIQKVARKSILVPLVHDEPQLYLSLMDTVFEHARGISYNTEQERELIMSRFSVLDTPSCLAGVAPDQPPIQKMPAVATRIGTDPYILYVGRIDKTKGCETLVRNFIHYKKMYPNELRLVLMGKSSMHIPRRADIITWGIATEQEKWQALRAARAVVVPSSYESLSLLLLEAFTAGRPCMVNADCLPTTAHCAKSNGGLWYRSSVEFVEILEYMYSHPTQADILGAHGKKYVDQYFTWKHILDAYDRLFAQMKG